VRGAVPSSEACCGWVQRRAGQRRTAQFRGALASAQTHCPAHRRAAQLTGALPVAEACWPVQRRAARRVAQFRGELPSSEARCPVQRGKLASSEARCPVQMRAAQFSGELPSSEARCPVQSRAAQSRGALPSAQARYPVKRRAGQSKDHRPATGALPSHRRTARCRGVLASPERRRCPVQRRYRASAEARFGRVNSERGRASAEAHCPGSGGAIRPGGATAVEARLSCPEALLPGAAEARCPVQRRASLFRQARWPAVMALKEIASLGVGIRKCVGDRRNRKG
ncbi:hypothetical protein CYMTET_31423, partial [Cymbomonas tetramitiformis]